MGTAPITTASPRRDWEDAQKETQLPMTTWENSREYCHVANSCKTVTNDIIVIKATCRNMHLNIYLNKKQKNSKDTSPTS